MKHLTVRVAWHDRAWDGAVCNHPIGNAFCLALDRIREERDDGREESVAGRFWADLSAAGPRGNCFVATATTRTV